MFKPTARTCLAATLLPLWFAHIAWAEGAEDEALAAMRRAATFYRERVATHGGYVYHYSLDLETRWGEGRATEDQIWVQPPGTPTVGMAYLAAYEATGDEYYLEAAREAALALCYGQVRSGGWTNCIDFDPRGKRVSLYRNGRGRGRNTSSLDDGQTQSALRLLVLLDEALDFRDKQIHEAAQVALAALLRAQFPNGGFPQVWDDDPIPDPPVLKASYPDYDWRTEGRIKNYWDMYTLNDNVCGYVAQTLVDAHRVYGDEKHLAALERLGDFLMLAQMPEPQPGWAQQYNYEMKPIWARKFEPPGVSGDETQEALETLLRIAAATGEQKYLAPLPSALAWLQRSRLPDGRLARYYELRTNRPLYMFRRGDVYTLTYDDSRLPKHYGYKTESRIDEIERLYGQVQRALRSRGGRGNADDAFEEPPPNAAEVREIVAGLDEQGRWVSASTGEPLIGQAKIPVGSPYLSSAVFSRNLTRLARYVAE